MKDFHLYGWLLSYDPLMILTKLAISLKKSIVFAKFIDVLLSNG